MEQPTNFIKLFQRIISSEPMSMTSKEEIHYYDLDKKWVKLTGGNKWMVWLN